MTTSKYTVLRVNRRPRTSEPFSPGPLGFPAPGPGAMGASTGVDDASPEPRLEVTDLSTTDVSDAARDPSVAAVAPVMPTRLIAPTDGPAAAQANAAWGIGAVEADGSSRDGAGVRVAVLDTGIDANHPAFKGVNLTEADFTGDGNGDVQGHGTHCAGTIFGRDVDGKRIGVARGVDDALIGKVLADNGSGDSSWLFEGMQWAVDGGAKVVSMSLGFDFPGLVKQLADGGWPVDLATSRALEGYRANLRMFDTLMQLFRAGNPFGKDAVVVAAAGNESRRDVDANYEIAVSVPAAAEGVVAVGAVGEGDGSGYVIADFSNTFPQISAPGVDVLSAKAGGGLVSFNGTSMATPHVAGVAALWWQAVAAQPIPTTSSTVVAKLLATARADVFAPGVDVADRGVGLVTAPA